MLSSETKSVRGTRLAARTQPIVGSKSVLALLLLITALAAALRLWRLDWALPFVPHPDEPAIMNVVLRMLRNSDPNPHFFYYPSLWIYVQALVGWAHLKWGMAQGIYMNAAQLPETTDIATSVPGFFAWGRAASALAGAATVPLLYSAARRVAGPVAGLVAAALLTFNTYHLIHSHYLTTDVAATLFTAPTLLVCLLIVERGLWRDYLLAGALAGLAAGAKHNAAIVAVAITAAHAMHWRARMVRELPRLIVAAVAMIGIFLLTSPFIVLAFAEFWADLRHQLGDYAAGAHGDVTGTWPVAAYVAFYREQALGLGGGLLALWGTLQLVRRRDGRVVVLLGLVLAYVLVFMAQGNHWMRNLLPTQVPLFVLAGVGGADVLHRVRVGLPRHAGTLLSAALLLLLLATPVASAVQYTRRLGPADSRVQAMQWIETQVPPGVPVAAELKAIPGAGASRWTEVHYLPEHELAWYRRQGYAYVIASSDTWRQLTLPAEYTQWAGREPVAEFAGAAAGLLGPRLVVYPTGVSPADVTERPASIVKVGGAQLVGATLGRPDPEAPEVGVDVQRRFKPGDVVGLRTFWQLDQPFTDDFFVFVHVLDAAGNTVAQRDTPPWQGRFPTSSWRSGTLVVDVNDLQLPPTLPPGTYTVVAGMFDPATGTAPPVTVDGVPQGSNAVSIASLSVATDHNE